MSEEEASGRRPYKMRARAAATAATKEKILDAGEAAFDELQIDEITLAWVAKQAGVSVQTVIRHFGTKEGLFMGLIQRSGPKMVLDRQVEAGGEVEEIVGVLIDHYERFGNRILRMLSQEERVPDLKVLTDGGRIYHLEWCKQAFYPALKGLRGARRERRAAQLAAVTDIYVWKVLRSDRGLSVAQTKLAIRELIESLTEPRR
jgi:AcrR family transcriptional regulator